MLLSGRLSSVVPLIPRRLLIAIVCDGWKKIQGDHRGSPSNRLFAFFHVGCGRQWALRG